MRQGYKKTEVGAIPEDWEVKKLEEVATVIMGQSPNSNSYNEDEDGIPFFQGNAEFGRMYPTIKKWCNEPLKIANPMDILISVRAPVGAVNINQVQSCIGRGLSAIRASDNIDFKYLYYSLLTSEKILNSSAQGSTFTAINSGDLKNLKIKIPPLKEQEKIAEILSTVDSQIDDTEKLIEKCKELKKGLMQKLLTKGIDHSEFKKTEVGEIPVEWEVKPISDVSSTMSGGTPNRSKKHYYINGNISWVKTGELGDKYIYDTEEKITDLAINESSAKLVPPYSVIIAMYGATIGKSSININEVTTNQACCSIICDKDILSYEYLYYYLDFNKDKLIALGAGGAQPNISQQIIRDFKITVPNVNEQEIIIQILSAIDNKVEKEQNKKQKLEELKKGLMQQLLTGKIRTV